MTQTRMTLVTKTVLRALRMREMYGLEIMRRTGLSGGTVYPLLARMERAGWVRSRAEGIDPRVEKRPVRKYYAITREGAQAVRDAGK